MAELDKRRCIFISASFLSKQYKSIPGYVLDNAIFLFNAKRSWLFPSNREEMLEARNQPSKYLEFDEDFKSAILSKEEQRMVKWFQPDNSWKSVSDFLEDIEDPYTGDFYLSLALDSDYWHTEFKATDSKYNNDVDKILACIKNGDFDYDAASEIIYQSNPSLLPTLYWTEG